MKLRSYQSIALAAIKAAHLLVASTIAILPTGTGKTVLFAHLASDYRSAGRTICVAHRDELIQQAADKIRAVTLINPEIEKAGSHANADSANPLASPFIVASVQTLTSGPRECRRMRKFNPFDFALVIIDEGHRAAADTYREVIAHFRQNPACRVLLVTATGDRADGQGLACVADSIAYTMDIHEAVRDGWLVPVRQTSVVVQGLDFSKCRTTGGDLNAEDLAAAMEFESVLHPIAHATIELAGGLKQGALTDIRDAEDRQARLVEMLGGRRLEQTLVFAPSVKLAEVLADIFCRWVPGSAVCVHGKTPEEQRRLALDEYRTCKRPILVNVGIATEGFDAPCTKNVVMARPTKSRVLATQMVGRGTRPSEAVAHLLGDLPDAPSRHAMIAASDKPYMMVLDFVGNSGRHRLVSAVDVLAGDRCEQSVLDLAAEMVAAGEVEDVEQAIANAQVETEVFTEVRNWEAERAQAELDQAELHDLLNPSKAKLRQLVGTTDYHTQEMAGVSADGTAYGAGTEYDRATPKVRPGGASDKQIDFLVKLGVKRETAIGFSVRQAGAVITDRKAKVCTIGQRKALKRQGYVDTEIDTMNFDAASAALDAERSVA